MKVDPITLEVVNNALVGVAEQMAVTILRTSYSTVIREMLDDRRAAVVQRFHDQHLRLYAHNRPDSPVEFVNGRVAAIGLMVAAPVYKKTANHAVPTVKERRPVYFDEADGFVDTPVYNRETLGPGSEIDGPAIVEQIDTTIVIHPGQRVSADGQGNLLIAIGG